MHFSMISKCPVKNNATFRAAFLLFLGVAYLLVGAFVFSAAELENETNEKTKLLLLEKQLKANINLSESDYQLLTSTILKLDAHSSGPQWTFTGAFYFAITVVTTIGYGHSVPHTEVGKIVCIFYSIIGVPFWLITFQCMGERLNAAAKHCWKSFGRKGSSTSEKVTQRKLIAFGILSCFAVTLIGIITFAHLEGWTYVNSAYYVVMTLSTIGFGDYVALQDCGSLEQNVFHVLFSFLYIVLGLTVVGAFMNLTIVRLFMTTCCDGSCDPEDKSTSRALGSNYDTAYANDFKDEERSFESKDTLYVNTRTLQEEEQKYDNCERLEAAKIQKKSFKKIKDILKKLWNKRCCCSPTKTKDHCETNKKEQNKTAPMVAPSPCFARTSNFNHNNNISVDDQETQLLDVTVFTTSNSKDNSEKVMPLLQSSTITKRKECSEINQMKDFLTLPSVYQIGKTKQTVTSKPEINENQHCQGQITNSNPALRSQRLPLAATTHLPKRDSFMPALERQHTQNLFLLPGQCSPTDTTVTKAKTCQFQEKILSSTNKKLLPCPLAQNSLYCPKSKFLHCTGQTSTETKIQVYL